MFYLFFILSLIFDGIIYFCALFKNFEFLIDLKSFISSYNFILIIVNIVFLLFFLLVFIFNFMALGASGGYPGWRREHLRKCSLSFLKIIFIVISMMILLIKEGFGLIFSLLLIIGGIIGFYIFIWLGFLFINFLMYEIHRL